MDCEGNLDAEATDITTGTSGLEIDTVSTSSMLDQLRASIETKNKQTVVYNLPADLMPGLPGDLDMEFSSRITNQELERWRNRSRAKGAKSRDDIDARKFAGLVLAEKNVAMKIGDKTLVDNDGDNITVRSDDILTMTETTTAADAVCVLLGDGTAASWADQLVQDAGYGGDVMTKNPTQTSSHNG